MRVAAELGGSSIKSLLGKSSSGCALSIPWHCPCTGIVHILIFHIQTIGWLVLYILWVYYEEQLVLKPRAFV